MNKSQAAFRASMRTMFDLSEKKRPYFWTFTLAKKLSVPAAFRAWRDFVAALMRYGSSGGKHTIYGLRVAELHPNGHGLHFHCVLNRHIPIHAIRQRAEHYGFFWIDVRRTLLGDASGIADYLTKYLTKAGRPEELKGRRLWAPIGKWETTKVRNIVVESEFAEAYRQRYRQNVVLASLASADGLRYRKENHFEIMEAAAKHVWQVVAGERYPLLPRNWETERERFDADKRQQLRASWLRLSDFKTFLSLPSPKTCPLNFDKCLG